MKAKDFLYFLKSDRSALLIVFAVIFVIALLIYFVGGGNNTIGNGASIDSTYSSKYSNSSRFYHQNGERVVYYRVNGRQAELFPFDPNIADSTQLLRLGLQPWQVRSIYKYRAKGGIFRSPTDFARLYGLTRKQFIQMEPYIHISQDYSPAANMFATRTEMPKTERDTLKYPTKLKAFEHVSINAADTSMLKRVPGIGSYFAQKIIFYRERLGGFYDTKQLLEIDGFPEDALKYMSLSGGTIKKINVNKLTLNQLHHHPYISFYQARAITDYRRLRGNLHSLNELRLLKDFPPEEIKRLEPYVEF